MKKISALRVCVGYHKYRSVRVDDSIQLTGQGGAWHANLAGILRHIHPISTDIGKSGAICTMVIFAINMIIRLIIPIYSIAILFPDATMAPFGGEQKLPLVKRLAFEENDSSTTHLWYLGMAVLGKTFGLELSLEGR
ncbi:hypothetical protein BO99DRAFT_130589 [Aspergillus violaceofuscus CBS 115571]|uniref:Uncharacterized protein n=1 Tax=Aspergillus violaceofuscus (strain CBS 115571) TaxID=1450538 RepID=A0A2V5IJB1_ASPV1|nr:hypothetical protein BO99DRAFT_130589 [Aspergillus violaceofuscus CBS 115571]